MDMTILTYGLGDRQNEGDHPFLDRSDGHPSVSQIHGYIRNLRFLPYSFTICQTTMLQCYNVI